MHTCESNHKRHSQRRKRSEIDRFQGAERFAQHPTSYEGTHPGHYEGHELYPQQHGNRLGQTEMQQCGGDDRSFAPERFLKSIFL